MINAFGPRVPSWLRPAAVGCTLALIMMGCSHSGHKRHNDHHSSASWKAQREACANKLGIEVPSNCRSIPVSHPYEGLENFRPFTKPSKRSAALAPRTVYRSDAFHGLSASDVAKLEKAGIKAIIDLRSDAEIKAEPNAPIKGVFQYHYPIGTDPAKLAALGLTPQDRDAIKKYFLAGQFDKVDKFMKDRNLDVRKERIKRYEDFTTDFTPSIKGALLTLKNPKNFPVAIHCHGGKDRTGFVAALIQDIAGYDRNDMMRDYLTTNLYSYPALKKRYAVGVKSLQPAFGAHSEQLDASLKAINRRYGSVHNYLVKEVGLSEGDISQIRANLKRAH